MQSVLATTLGPIRNIDWFIGIVYCMPYGANRE